MLSHDEKRDFIRMDVNCDVTYKPADSSQVKVGKCTNLSGAGLSFIADQMYTVGLAMEVNILPKTALTPPMTAYIEVVRVTDIADNQYEIAAIIKSIKGN